MSMNHEDIDRAAELERMFTSLYPEEVPFSFSKTISKALEIAYESLTSDQLTQGTQEPEKEKKSGERHTGKKIFGKRLR